MYVSAMLSDELFRPRVLQGIRMIMMLHVGSVVPEKGASVGHLDLTLERGREESSDSRVGRMGMMRSSSSVSEKIDRMRMGRARLIRGMKDDDTKSHDARIGSSMSLTHLDPFRLITVNLHVRDAANATYSLRPTHKMPFCCPSNSTVNAVSREYPAPPLTHQQ
jgi:hypothetical protein